MITRRNLLRLLGLSTILPAAVAANVPSEQTPAPTPRDQAITDWDKQTRYPVTESNDETIHQLLASITSQQPLAFYYFGGTSPRKLRLATVESIFRIESSPHSYVTTYCHLRREHRTFRADKIALA